MRIAQITIVIGLGLCLCATDVAGQRPGKNVPESAVGNPMASIKGVVRDAATHQPLAYLRIILEADRAGYAGEATTDSSGKFEFQGLAHVAYTVRVKTPGYKAADQSTNACDPSTCRHIDLSLQNVDYATFELVPLPTAENPASLDTVDPPLPEAARAEFTKGKELAESGKPAESISHFKKAIATYPRYEQAYFRLGLAYLDQKNTVDAESALTKATELVNTDAGAWLALGTLYAAQKDFTAAEKPLSRALELNPDLAEAHCQLSLTYWAEKKFADSDSHAQKCAALKPEYAQAHLLLGNLGLAKRDQAAALREYKEYLRLDPQGSYAAAVRQQVNRLEQALGSQAQAK